MAKDDLQRMPHKVRGRDDVWWYEEPAGISVVVQCGCLETKIVNISWRSLRAALRRLDR